jgi:hypothetical protein
MDTVLACTVYMYESFCIYGIYLSLTTGATPDSLGTYISAVYRTLVWRFRDIDTSTIGTIYCTHRSRMPLSELEVEPMTGPRCSYNAKF